MPIIGGVGWSWRWRRSLSGRARPDVHRVRSTAGQRRQEPAPADRGDNAPRRGTGPPEPADRRRRGKPEGFDGISQWRGPRLDVGDFAAQREEHSHGLAAEVLSSTAGLRSQLRTVEGGSPSWSAMTRCP